MSEVGNAGLCAQGRHRVGYEVDAETGTKGTAGVCETASDCGTAGTAGSAGTVVAGATSGSIGRATLEEARQANLLLHVADASNAGAFEQIATVYGVLEELGIEAKDTLLVLNKIDQVEDRSMLQSLADSYDHVVATSTVTGEGLTDLVAMLEEFAGHDMLWVRLAIPPSRHDVLSLIHREGQMERVVHLADGTTWLEAVLPKKFQGRVAEYLTLEIPEEVAEGNGQVVEPFPEEEDEIGEDEPAESN